MVLALLFLVFTGLLTWQIIRIARPRAAAPARCARCGYDVVTGGPEVCPECGGKYAEGGVIPAVVPPKLTRPFIAAKLALFLFLLGVLLMAPLSLMWPWQTAHTTGDSLYQPFGVDGPPSRLVQVTYDLHSVWGRAASDGSIGLTVKGPDGRFSKLSLDVPSMKVRDTTAASIPRQSPHRRTRALLVPVRRPRHSR